MSYVAFSCRHRHRVGDGPNDAAEVLAVIALTPMTARVPTSPHVSP